MLGLGHYTRSVECTAGDKLHKVKEGTSQLGTMGREL